MKHPPGSPGRFNYVVRDKTTLNPVVRAGYGAEGQVLRGVRGKKLREVRKKGLVDFDVIREQDDKTFRARLIASWNRSQHQYRYLVTNLPRSRYTPQAIGQAYRLRWQIALPFKEWKSYANLHSFNTANPAIAEGLIWAAVAAAAMKRYLAHMTQGRFSKLPAGPATAFRIHINSMSYRRSRHLGVDFERLPQVLRAVEVSTRKVSMCAHHVLGDLFRALISQSHGE